MKVAKPSKNTSAGGFVCVKIRIQQVAAVLNFVAVTSVDLN